MADGSVLIDTKLNTSPFEKGLSALGGLVSKSGVTKLGALAAQGIAAVSGALTAMGGFAVKTGMEFDASMAQVAATMGKSIDDIEEMRQAAIKYGAETAFSATEAAQALNYLALAGYGVEQAVEVLPSVLDLAAAGDLDLAYASDLATDAMAALGKTANAANLTHFGDELAMTASKANTSVAQLGEAILTVGGTATMLAGDTVELNAALGVLANRGIKGSEAGTHLRNVILSLTAPTDVAATAMEALGLQVTNAEGNLRPLNDILADFNAATAGMGQAAKMQYMNAIFNKTDLAAVQALMAGLGEEWESLEGYIKDCDGAMAQMAETQLDNLAGDVENFGGALESLGIAAYDTVLPALRELVSTGASLVEQLTAAVTENGLDGLATAFGDVLAQAISILSGYIPGVVSMAVTLVQALVDGITQNAGTIGATVVEVMSVMSAGVLESIPMLIEAGASLGLALIDGASAKLPGLITTLSGAVTSATSKIRACLPKLVASGKSLIQSLIKGVKQNLPKLTYEVTTALADLWIAALDVKTDLLELGGALIESLGIGLITSLPKLAAKLPQIVSGLANFLLSKAYMLAEVGVSLLTQLVAKLPLAVQRICASLPEIITSIIDTIGQYAGDFATLGTQLFRGLAETLPQAFTSIWNSLSSVDWAALGAQIWSAIKSGISATGDWIKGLVLGDKYVADSSSWSDVGKEIWDAIKLGFDAAGDWIKELVLGEKYTKDAKWSAVGAELWAEIKSGFKAAGDWIKELVLGDAYTKDAKWADVGKDLWADVKSGFDATGDWIKALVVGESYTTGDGWDAVGKAIWDAIKTGISATGDWVAALINKGKGYIPSVDQWASIGKSVWTSIKSGISAANDWLKDLVFGTALSEGSDWSTLGSTIWTSVKSGISAAADWLKDLVFGNALSAESDWSSIGSTIWESVKSGIEAADNWLKDLVSTSAVTEGSDWSGIGKQIITKISEGLNTLKDTDIGDLSSIATTIASKIFSGKIDLVSNVATFATNIVNKISTYTGWSKLTGQFGSIASSILDGIKNAIPKALTAVSGLATAIANLLSGDTVKSGFSSLTDLATGIINGIVAAMPTLKETAKGIVSALGTVLSEIPWAEATESVKEIGTALLDAMSAALPGLSDVAQDVMKELGAALKKVEWADIGADLGDLGTALLDAIVAAFDVTGENAIDFDGLINSIGEGLVAAAEGLATFAGTVAGKLAGYLTNPENLAKFAKVGVAFVAEIVNGVLGLGVSLVEGAAGVLTNTIVGFFRGVFGIEVDPYVEQMVSDFFDMEFDVPLDTFDGYGKACGYALVDAMGTALTSTAKLTDAITAWGIAVESGYAQFFPEFEFLGNESVVSLYQGMLTGIESGSVSAHQSAKEAALLTALGYADGLMNAFDVHQPDIADAMFSITESSFVNLSDYASQLGFDIGALMGVDLPAGYIIALNEGRAAIVDATTGIVTTAAETIESGWTADDMMALMWEHTFSTAFAEIEQWKPELTALLEGMGVEAGSLLGVALPDGVAQGLKDGTLSVEEAAAAIAAAAIMAQTDVDAAVADNTAKGEDAGAAVAEGESAAESDVEDAAGALYDAATGAFDPMAAELGATTEEAMEGMEGAIQNGLGPVEAAAASVAAAADTSMQETLSAENGRAIGDAWIDGLSSGITAQGENIPNQITSIMAAAIMAVGESIPDFVYVGEMIASGIAMGITNGSGAIANAAVGAANAAYNAACSELGIASPSRVFTDVGLYCGLGVAKGLKKSQGAITDAMEGLTEAMADANVADRMRSAVAGRQGEIQSAFADMQTKLEVTNGSTDGAIDYDALGRSVWENAPDLDVNIDGEKAGSILEPGVSNKQGSKLKSQRRRKGIG